VNMTYSKTGLALTESFEGCKLTAYQDIKGVWTIGYGHTGPEVHAGMTITAAQAEGLLIDDIQLASHCVNTAITVDLTQSEFDALVDFVFNLGCAAFCGSTMRRLINEGDTIEAAAQFDNWDHVKGKVVAGLLRRRQAETNEFNS
jgi:lysozyme